jgi:hypothetical protein
MPTYTHEYGKMRYQYKYLSLSSSLTHEDFKELLTLEPDQWIIHRVSGRDVEEEYFFDNRGRIYIVRNCYGISIGLAGEYVQKVKQDNVKTPIKFPPSRWRLSDEQIDVVKMIYHHSEIATYMSMIMSKLI